MEITELSPMAFALAIAAGGVSFLSPCVLPLVPGYLSFVSGVTLDRIHADVARVVRGTAAFVFGFALVFTLAGAGAGFVGSFLLQNQRLLEIGAGIALIVLGTLVAGVLPVRWLERERRVLDFRRPRGMVGAALVGMAFAVGWTPCVGPILASILTLAASGGSTAGGAALLFVYSLGLGVPFLLTGIFFTRAAGAFEWFKRHLGAVKVASGILLVVYGILMVSGQFSLLAARLSGYQLIEF